MVVVPGGRLFQEVDTGLTGESKEEFKSQTKKKWPSEMDHVGKFGVAVCRALKSNTITLIHEIPSISNTLQLVSTGQKQPNRIDTLKTLTIPQAQNMLQASKKTLQDCMMMSDAFFPFRDTVDAAQTAGIRFIIQPGGSIKDKDSIAACDEFGMAMAFTGRRHFRH
jgi:phosphoribosylaminoimidazolecarboxamide formyltransferase/IMP cyclohydrolase